MKKISVIFGTRPEAIKLAPIVLALQKNGEFACEVCVTGQHREMLDQVLEVFGIKTDCDLDLMQSNQGLADLTARALVGVHEYLKRSRPDLVLVQGDTTTVFAAALAAFYQRIPVGHVEAGLRTGNLSSPWPEEMNRVIASRLTSLHFAPTAGSRENLLREGIASAGIHVTGNTVIDALFLALEKTDLSPPYTPGLPSDWRSAWKDRPLVLITGHRRENFGLGLESICRAIGDLAQKFPHVNFVYPVHLNPNVREPVHRILALAETNSIARNIFLIEPLTYLPFVSLMQRSTLILTDSGGVQEEAPSLGKPVLVMRDTTERPEAVEAGTVKLVGTDYATIVRETSLLLNDENARLKMAKAHNPYGDGKATQRICGACAEFLANEQMV